MNQERPIKLLFLITKATWGGAQKYVFDLATHAPKDQFAVSLACGVTGRLSSALSERGLTVQQVPYLGRDIALISDVTSFFKLLWYLNAEKPDVLHLNSSKAAALGALAGRIAGVKTIIFTAHGWPFKEQRGYLSSKLIYLVSWITTALSHRVIVVSYADELLGKRMWGVARKIEHIPLGRDVIQFLSPEEAFRSMFGGAPVPLITSATVRLTTIAELTSNKGIRYAIDAMEHLTHQGVDAIYVVAGAGEEQEQLREYTREKGVSERVYFPGFIKDASHNLRGFDAYLSPSIKEGMPYALIEAAQAGIPVVATTIVQQDFGHLPQFTFVPARDSLALADAIARVSKKPRVQSTTDPFPLADMIRRTMALYSH